MGLDSRESTPGFKRQMIVLNGETRSLKRASIVMKRVVGLKVLANTIERISLEAGNDLEVAAQQQWQRVLTGDVAVPSAAIVEFDGGRIRTRQAGLPTTSAWMESAVNEMNDRIKGTGMFWNNPEGAEAILQIRAAVRRRPPRPPAHPPPRPKPTSAAPNSPSKPPEYDNP